MLRVVGAGLPRTATMSLRDALPKLLGGKCYHMSEVFENPGHADAWISALEGDPPDWSKFFDGYTAAVDWPPSAFWPDLADAFPDAVILLSKRTDGAAWYRSVSNTVLHAVNSQPGEIPNPSFLPMVRGLWGKVIAGDPNDADASAAAYERYVQHVRDTAPADRLVEWSAPMGWEPICEALGVPVPDEPFPHVNSTAEFQSRMQDRVGPAGAQDAAGDGQ
ncbi:MAG: sulfotransferase family protein [Stackebrandtia sp.]